MKNQFSIFILIIFIILGCGDTTTKQNSSPESIKKETATAEKELFVNKLTASIIDGKEDRKEEKLKINDEYFEISFAKQFEHYIAVKDLENSILGNDITLVSISIVDEAGQLVKFNNSTEFLNHMSDRGYEMVSETKGKSQTNYTFKRK